MFLVFNSLSYSSTVNWIELGVGLIELGIDLRINNARRTVLAHVSGLVELLLLPNRPRLDCRVSGLVYHIFCPPA